MAEHCSHMKQSLDVISPEGSRYYCVDCEVEVWYVPMTLAEISQWVGWNSVGLPRIVKQAEGNKEEEA